MRGNPINLLLTGIAVADMFVMMEYIPFATHMYLLKDTYTSLEEKVILWAYEFSRQQLAFRITEF